MNKKIKYSFKQMCIDTNRKELLDRWDYELNNITPDLISSKSGTKRWFKCPLGKHKSELKDISYIGRNDKYMAPCNGCNSFAQHIIDKYDEDYLNKIWSDKNEKSPWDYSYGSNQIVFFNCVNNPDHVYPQAIYNRANDCGCPYCNNKNINSGIVKEQSLGALFPQVITIWSNKNEKSPYEYAPSSGQYVYWKCENNKHEDYYRKISNSGIRDFKCPKCSRENQVRLRGENHPNWKGGATPQKVIDRTCLSYKEWRKEVYEKDNYLCQVCLNPKHNNLRAHHIYNFADHPDLRFNVSNGITTCAECHDNKYVGAFHNVYGTLHNTPEQFQEYVELRRKELGIDIPFNIYDYMSSFDDDDMEIDDYGLDISSFNPKWVRVSETGICSISIPLSEIEI